LGDLAASFYALTVFVARFFITASKSVSFYCFYVDSAVGAVYKKVTGQLAANNDIRPTFPFFAFIPAFLFGARPHECQIGSGEEIRTAVRQTFLSPPQASSEYS
jgi:hypothetical protein